MAGEDNRDITIYDIAKEAGVSASTVSRVLTNKTKVSAEKREKVLALIEKYHFRPNAMARGLADTQTHTIGVLSADIRNPYYASMFVACERAARAAGYTAILCNFLGDFETEKSLLLSLEAQKADAIIQLGGRVDDLISNEQYVELVNQVMEKLPVVITGKLDGTMCHAVRIDSMRAMELLMNHLLGLGHRRIALIGGNNDVLSTFEKFQCYKQILKKNKIPYDEKLVAPAGSYDFDTAYRQTNDMLDAGVGMTAIIAINDFAAMGVSRSLKEHEISIPQDISLVSYDNTYMSQMCVPTLTSVDYNYEEYARKLIDTATALIEGRKVGRLRMVMPDLVVRGSSGPCPQ